MYTSYTQNKIFYSYVKNSSDFINMNLFLKKLMINKVNIIKKYLTKSNSTINIGSFSSKVLIATMAFQRDFIYNF